MAVTTPITLSLTSICSGASRSSRTAAASPSSPKNGGRWLARYQKVTEFAFVHGGTDDRILDETVSTEWTVGRALGLKGRANIMFVDTHVEGRNFRETYLKNSDELFLHDNNNVPAGTLHF